VTTLNELIARRLANWKRARKWTFFYST